MRKLADLLEGRERVWFWIGDDEVLKRRFINDCVACGCKIKRDAVCGRAMALYADLSILFVSMLPWVYSFEPGLSISNVLKIDYKRFVEGDHDYIITESGFIE